MRILLVEDAPSLRLAFGRLLRLHGHDVREANDGVEALECVPEFQPELVVTDLMMPRMGGIELIQRLRSTPDTATLPIVALTADASDQIGNRACQAGAAVLLTKPVDLSLLLDRLRSLQVLVG